jgi:aryl-alcohol dehydrogenase-like predicted oxidoreductase
LAEVLREIANGHGATATHVALAWLLRRDDHVIAIPGSTKPKHVADNAAALAVELSDDEFDAIDRASA